MSIELIAVPAVKRCTGPCGKDLPLSEYYTYTRRGMTEPQSHSYCKVCHKLRAGRRRVDPMSFTASLPNHVINNYEQLIGTYEEMLGNAKEAKKKEIVEPADGHVETIVISDLHVPDERMDLLAQIAAEHEGKRLVIAGDLDDFEMLSRFDQVDWTAPTLQQSIMRRDGLLDFLSSKFSSVEIMLGNHDLRMPRRAARALGADYAWISQQFLLWSYERRHGIKVITNEVTRQSGRQVPYLHYYHQIGDCLIGHVEVSGRPPGKSVEKAHDFFTSWKRELGLNDFRVILQAHSHKTTFYKHAQTKVYCYEIGALCDIPAYSLTSRQHYAPPQLGYFHLVQDNGVTDINKSRLVLLDSNV